MPQATVKTSAELKTVHGQQTELLIVSLRSHLGPGSQQYLFGGFALIILVKGLCCYASEQLPGENPEEAPSNVQGVKNGPRFIWPLQNQVNL